MIEIKNAVITSAEITSGDHGILSVWVNLDYGGSGQGFGGYVLYTPVMGHTPMSGHRVNYAGHFIWRTMEVADVTDWSKMKGRNVRVKSEHAKVHEIGHILKDDWFNPAQEFARMERGE